MIILDGKLVAQQRMEVLKKHISALNFQVKMTIIQVGDVFESNKYIAIKLKKSLEVGIQAKHIKLPQNIKQDDLIKIIKEECQITHGLIVQLPLPKHLDKQVILNSVDIDKDIDGLSEYNQNLFYENKDSIIPATAQAIIWLLNYYQITIENKNIAIIGDSNLVGKPTKELLLRMNANVQNYNLTTGIGGVEKADILIVAAGSPNLVKANNIKDQAIIIDVGVSKLDKTNKIYGDVDFESVKNKAKAISLPIGGIGPLTVVSLLENLLKACQKNSLIEK